jgi:hypothetical protein
MNRKLPNFRASFIPLVGDFSGIVDSLEVQERRSIALRRRATRTRIRGRRFAHREYPKAAASQLPMRLEGEKWPAKINITIMLT